MISASETAGSPTNPLIRRVYRHQSLPVLFGATGQPPDKATPRRAGSPPSDVVAMRAALPAHSGGWEAVDAPQAEAPEASKDAPAAHPGAQTEAAPPLPASVTSAIAPLRWARRALSRLVQPPAQRTAQEGAVAAGVPTQPDAAPPAPVQPAQTHTAAHFDLRMNAPAALSAPVSASPPAAARTTQPEPASSRSAAQPSAAQQGEAAAAQGRVVQAQLAPPAAAGYLESPRVSPAIAGAGASIVQRDPAFEPRSRPPSGMQPAEERSAAPPQHVAQAQLAPPDAASQPEAPAAFPPVAGLTARSWARQPVEAPAAAAQPRPQPAPPAAAPSLVEHGDASVPPSEAVEDRTWERLKAILRAHEGDARADAPSTSPTAPPIAPPAALPVQRTVESGALQPTINQESLAERTVETPDASGAVAPPASLAAKADPSPATTPRGDEPDHRQPVAAQPVEPGRSQPAARSDSPVLPVALSVAQVETMLRSLPPARATDSAIQVIAPRTPRPVQRQPAPTVENDPNGAGSLTALESEAAAVQMAESPSRAASQFTIHNSQSTIHNSSLAPRPAPPAEPETAATQRMEASPLAPRPSPLPSAIQMVETEIGEMPVDLWALIGEAPPLPTVSDPRREQGAARIAPGSESGAGVADLPSARSDVSPAAWMAGDAASAGVALPPGAEAHPALRGTLERERTNGQGPPAVVHSDAHPATLQRQPVDVATAVMRAATGETGAPGDAAALPESAPGSTPAQPPAPAELDIYELARQVYPHLRRRLAVEWERLG